MTYHPDSWVVLKFITPKRTYYKVLGSWSGGFTTGDSWRMNSGITGVELTKNSYDFHGYSGSVYSCGKNSYGTNMYTQGVLDGWIEEGKLRGMTIEVMPENTKWNSLDYSGVL